MLVVLVTAAIGLSLLAELVLTVDIDEAKGI
ncbi:hypothetical protein J2T09_001358 [Neorhizobium huautlense]|uniref:Uncharacterized protein n=1 Tax=Neorhizobium huautlense TaxID=67774 RepID=A0ABT9PR41_9HYPH|nr:hypothetical protein [Neorhizobium huautlense]